MVHGAIVLCGGKSSRMGRDKLALPFGNELLLQRVVRLLSEAVAPENIVVVSALDQALPTLPRDVAIVHDQTKERGPLEGLASGMRGLAGRVDAAYVTACDVPFLSPALVLRMFELFGDHDIVVPRDDQHHHPLAAVYRLSVLTSVQQLLNADRLRPRDLFDVVNTRVVHIEELRCVDPQLATLKNLNHPADYQAALAAAGFV